MITPTFEGVFYLIYLVLSIYLYEPLLKFKECDLYFNVLGWTEMIRHIM